MQDPLVTIARYGSLIHAQLARARLLSSGIEAHVPDEGSAGVLGESFDGLSGVRLLVRESARRQAAELLDAPAEAPSPAAEPDPRARCPVCHGALQLAAGGRLRAFLGRLAGRPPRRAPCGVCGYRTGA